MCYCNCVIVFFSKTNLNRFSSLKQNQNENVGNIMKKHFDENKLVAAICAGKTKPVKLVNSFWHLKPFWFKVRQLCLAIG